MKQLREAIDFVANPFVAVADFLMLLVIVLTLAILQQSVASSRLMERMAILELQQTLLKQMSDVHQKPSLRNAYSRGSIRQTWIDGDLQRFWLDGNLLFRKDNTTVIDSHRGAPVLAAIGSMLKRYQGNLNDPGSGMFKRVIIEGHAARGAGDDARVWTLSLERARAALAVIQSQGGLSPKLLEASGRGCWVSPEIDRTGAATSADRIEIVIIYSGNRAMQYLQGQAPLRPSPTH